MADGTVWCGSTTVCCFSQPYIILCTDGKPSVQIASSSSSSRNVTCPICNELVAGTRFAPHLEKCMNGGKRGSRKFNDALFEDSSGRAPKAAKVVEVDPYPTSLIVRIRLKNGGQFVLMWAWSFPTSP